MSSSSTSNKKSNSLYVTSQSWKRLSPILFLNLIFTKVIAKNALSTLTIATGKSNAEASKQYHTLYAYLFSTIRTKRSIRLCRSLKLSSSLRMTHIWKMAHIISWWWRWRWRWHSTHNIFNYSLFILLLIFI